PPVILRGISSLGEFGPEEGRSVEPDWDGALAIGEGDLEDIVDATVLVHHALPKDLHPQGRAEVVLLGDRQDLEGSSRRLAVAARGNHLEQLARCLPVEVGLWRARRWFQLA